MEPPDFDLIFKCQEGHLGSFKMVSIRYLKKCFTNSHQIWYTEAPWQAKYQVRISWSWTYFQGHEDHLRWQHMQDCFRSISGEEFDVSSRNFVHRSIRARRRPRWSRWTWPYFQGQKGHSKWFPAQYLKKYVMYPHQIWYTEAPGESKDQVRTEWPWPNFKITKVICVGVFQYLKKY